MIGRTEIQVTARLDADGKVSAKVTGVCPYGTGDATRTASASVDITDKDALDAIGKVLQEATQTTVTEEPARPARKATDDTPARPASPAVTGVAADVVDRQARDSALESAYVATRKKEEL